jgi:Zn-dependent peptidase ImmA (M78 family)
VDRLAGAELALVSGPWAPRAIEQRANAFAAELLMPHALVGRAYASHGSNPRWGSYEELLEAAKTLDVSPDALSNHLYNQRFIDIAERDALRAQLSRARISTEAGI